MKAMPRDSLLRFAILFLAPTAIALCGCERPPVLQFQPSEKVAVLSPALQTKIREELEKYCGTPERPKLLGDDKISTAHLLYGRQVYMQRCVQCHGVTGDGQGPAAKWLSPQPRDYRRGKFKFTSSPYDSKPRRVDLIRTLRSGVPGTSMPAFNLVAAKDIEAVVDYVLVLTHRGELEFLLIAEAEGADEVEPDAVTDSIKLIQDQWKEADASPAHILSAQPVFTAEHVAAGKQAFLTRGCSKCHGEDGRGQTPENLRGDLKDAWEHPIRAADLTSGFLHGGHHPDDIYLRIFNGISGTPMPSFKSVLAAEPDTFWNLVAYVLYVSNRRRVGEIPEAGTIPTPTAAGARPAGGE